MLSMPLMKPFMAVPPTLGACLLTLRLLPSSGQRGLTSLRRGPTLASPGLVEMVDDRQRATPRPARPGRATAVCGSQRTGVDQTPDKKATNGPWLRPARRDRAVARQEHDSCPATTPAAAVLGRPDHNPTIGSRRGAATDDLTTSSARAGVASSTSPAPSRVSIRFMNARPWRAGVVQSDRGQWRLE